MSRPVKHIEALRSTHVTHSQRRDDDDHDDEEDFSYITMKQKIGQETKIHTFNLTLTITKYIFKSRSTYIWSDLKGHI